MDICEAPLAPYSILKSKHKSLSVPSSVSFRHVNTPIKHELRCTVSTWGIPGTDRHPARSHTQQRQTTKGAPTKRALLRLTACVNKPERGNPRVQKFRCFRRVSQRRIKKSCDQNQNWEFSKAKKSSFRRPALLSQLLRSSTAPPPGQPLHQHHLSTDASNGLHACLRPARPLDRQRVSVLRPGCAAAQGHLGTQLRQPNAHPGRGDPAGDPGKGHPCARADWVGQDGGVLSACATSTAHGQRST